MQLASSTSAEPLPVRGGGSPHPRSEGNDMPEAIAKLLDTRPYYGAVPLKRRDRSIGTPGAANRPVATRPEDREEQVGTDRQPARRGEHLVLPRSAAPVRSSMPLPSAAAKPARTSAYTALDQALKTADLLLQAGGFSVIVFDLGSTPAEIAWRIPLATWFRFRAACERTRVSLLLLTQHACARSSAGLVVRMQGGRMQIDQTVLTGMEFAAERERLRFEPAPTNVVTIRKPPKSVRSTSAAWSSQAAWVQTR
jgi:recombination protein RecA